MLIPFRGLLPPFEVVPLFESGDPTTTRCDFLPRQSPNSPARRATSYLILPVSFHFSSVFTLQRYDIYSIYASKIDKKDDNSSINVIKYLSLPSKNSKMKETKQERTVIHLEKDGQHYYFGSLAAIYTIFTKEDIGISYGSLRNYGLAPEKSYQNKYATIRKSTLITIPKKD
jgi:hypothetical protein